MTIIGPLSSSRINPTSPLIEYTGFSGLNITTVRARPIRPVTFTNGLEYSAPGARIRFRTESPTITFHLSNNGLMTNSLSNLIFTLLVNDEVYADYNSPNDIIIDFANVIMRKIELVFPYGAGYDFLGLSYNPIYSTLPFLPRRKLICAGDSITQGAFATMTRSSWTYILANLNNLELFNMGFSGGVVSTLGDGSWAQNLQPNIITLLTHNDFNQQVPIETYKTNCTSLITKWLTTTNAQIYAITALWTSTSLSIPSSLYRIALSEVVTSFASNRVILIDGLSLAINSTVHFPDGVHPNDAGSMAIASSLNKIIN